MRCGPPDVRAVKFDGYQHTVTRFAREIGMPVVDTFDYAFQMDIF